MCATEPAPSLLPIAQSKKIDRQSASTIPYIRYASWISARGSRSAVGPVFFANSGLAFVDIDEVRKELQRVLTATLEAVATNDGAVAAAIPDRAGVVIDAV